MKKLLLNTLVLLLTAHLSNAQYLKVEDIQVSQYVYSSSFKKAGNFADSADYYEWANGQWELHVRRTFEYGANEEISITYEKDAGTGAIINRLTYTYDSEDRQVLLSNERNDNGSYVPQIKESYAYDAKGNRTSFLAEQYNSQSQTWSILYGDSFEFVYDNNDRITEYTLYQQTNNGLVPFQKLIWEDFNGDDHPTTLTVKAYSGGSYINYIKLDNMTWLEGYDYEQFDPTAYFGYQWDGSGQKWLPQIYDTSVMDNGLRTKKYLFQWNGTDKDTVQKTEYAYDAQGHRKETIVYSKTVNTWAAADGRRDEKTYGSYVELQERLFSFLDLNSSTWTNQEKEVYYYNGLSIGELPLKSLKLYPNPANGIVNLDLPETAQQVRIIGLHGGQYSAETNLEGRTIKVQHLPPGVYQVLVETTTSVYTGRFIKK